MLPAFGTWRNSMSGNEMKSSWNNFAVMATMKKMGSCHRWRSKIGFFSSSTDSSDADASRPKSPAAC